MRKEQDKKPDFLQDINAGIWDELTKDEKIKNAAGMVGGVKELKEVSHICGLPFTGYLGKISTPRLNDIIDEVVVAFEEKAVAPGDNQEYTGKTKIPEVGDRVLVYGKIQTLKDFKSGRVLVFVLADYVAVSPKAMLQNDIAIMGELAYRPRYRETPKGKRITDIFVQVQNVLTAGTCFIPCICWQETADEVADWQQGDKVKLLARYQSREYLKRTEKEKRNGLEVITEKRIAYELSVQGIKRTGEAGHES